MDGTVFDSSVERGQPATFPLNQVIKCWTEGVGMMKVGGRGKLVCPSDIAYGDRGAPPKIKPGSTLVFDVELLEIVKNEPPAAAPPTGPKAEPNTEEKK
jgi:FKBP-type peptidyl-prolyl cis-trans isomerase